MCVCLLTVTSGLFQARVRSSRPGALLPLAGPSAPQSLGSSAGMQPAGLALPLACLDLASSSASIQLLRTMFCPSGQALRGDPSTAVALPGGTEQLGPDFGFTVGVRLDQKIARTFAEVEEKVKRRVGRLKAELQRREAELDLQRRDRQRLRREKQEVEERAAHLSRQVGGACPGSGLELLCRWC